MLELKNIVKDYPAGGDTVHALKGISLNFRRSEFVSILGPSGCGKTTTLNIIGGLDKYTSGDLVINGRSTKDFKDKDWDTYRNHSIGFVFQSYNLIPHQSVLQNVELALSLSGVNKKEARPRAIKALQDVGLGDQLRKKPSEMSGGQMQRVAIARALVNNPDILLLDEPTGALDTETSVQVMDLLKELARDRLVIMVTHNPDLALKYSTRIVRMLDGEIQSDSMPMSEEELATERKASIEKDKIERSKKKPSLKFTTSFALSLKNLFTKRGRTALTAFAGSIGIIGIALIYAVSQGMENYIDDVQESTLSTYPLTIESESTDMSSLVSALGETIADAKEGSEDGTVKESQFMSQVFAQIESNDMESFNNYLLENYDEVSEYINAVSYGYGVSPQIYTFDCNDDVMQVNPSSLFSGYMSSVSSYMSSGIFSEMVDNREMLDEQYDVLAGKWPENYDELVLVLQNSTMISDYMTYSLGFRDSSDLTQMMEDVMAGKEVELSGDSLEWTYDEILEWKFKLVNASDLYRYNSEYGVWESMSDDEDYMRDLVENGLDLKVVGIVTPKSGTSASALSVGLNYLPSLVDYVIAQAENSEIVQQQLSEEDTDVFSGKKFDEIDEEESEESSLDFNDMISVDSEAFSDAIGMDVSEEYLTQLMSGYISSISGEITADVPNVYTAEKDLTEKLGSLASGMLNSYFQANKVTVPYPQPTEMCEIKTSQVSGIVADYLAGEEAASLISALESKYLLPASAYTQVYTPLLESLLKSYISLASQDATVEDPSAYLVETAIDSTVTAFTTNTAVIATMENVASSVIEAELQSSILTSVSSMSTELISAVASSFHVDTDAIAGAFSFNMSEEDLTRLMNAYSSDTEDKSFDSNCRSLGYADRNSPTSIGIYLKDFDGKDKVKAFIDDYNDRMEAEGKDEMVINYTDITGVLMSSVKTIVDAVTYVLIAFVSISLIVSSIMIGVITLISVQERTKEIGILRAIGASKKNVSGMFNAETVIIGFASGVLGVAITYALCVPINIILHKLTGISTLSAVLPVPVAALLVGISVLLTLIAGIIPSRSAAKKDPVVALRTE